ncbi:hypothetical protein KY284_035521 [Solanum tuberosum]|nr:hypothetical protein KY284_035521 [Solanum tuberosum]
MTTLEGLLPLLTQTIPVIYNGLHRMQQHLHYRHLRAIASTANTNRIYSLPTPQDSQTSHPSSQVPYVFSCINYTIS